VETADRPIYGSIALRGEQASGDNHRANSSVTVPPVTERQWTDEVTRALAAAGLPWQLGSCWCEKSACAAELVHRSTGKTRVITLSLDAFSTAALRKAELVRVLQANSPTTPKIP
jgi:hypothetical protein